MLNTSIFGLDGAPLKVRDGVRATQRGAHAVSNMSAGMHLPYAAHVDDFTIVTKAGFYMQFIKLNGFAQQITDPSVDLRRKEIFHNLLKTNSDSTLGLWTHLIHRPYRLYPDGEYPIGFARDLNFAWKQKYDSNTVFCNELYLSIVKKTPKGMLRKTLNMFASRTRGKENYAQFRKDQLRDLYMTSKQFMDILSDYGPRQMGMRIASIRGNEYYYSEPLSFLNYLYNQIDQKVQLPKEDLSTYLPDKRVSFGYDTIELRGDVAADTKIAAMVSIKAYGSDTDTGMLNDLLRLPHELIVTQSYLMLDRDYTVDLVKKQLGKMEQVDDDAVSLYGMLHHALDEVASGELAFGEHHLSVQCIAKTPHELDRAVADTLSVFRSQGIKALREDDNQEALYWAQFPANAPYIARSKAISTRNFAGLCSFNNLPMGQLSGNYWGPAVTVLETDARTPYFFNFHERDIGVCCIFGRTGYGKTTLASFLVAMCMKYKPRLRVLDKDRGQEIFIRALGGEYHKIEPGVPTGWNPCQIEDTELNRNFLRDFLELLVKKGGTQLLSDDDKATIEKVVDGNFQLDYPSRRLSNLAPFLGAPTAGSIRRSFEPWIGEGRNAWLFDNPINTFELKNPIAGFDLTHVLGSDEIRSPVISLILYGISASLDGHRTIVEIEESWYPLSDPDFAASFENHVRTIRKNEGMMIFLDQFPEKFVNTEKGRVIFDQCATTIFLPNDKADQTFYMDDLKFSESEYKFILNTGASERKFMLRKGKEVISAKLDMMGLENFIHILSGRRKTLNIFDEVVARYGSDPSVWINIFLERVANET